MGTLAPTFERVSTFISKPLEFASGAQATVQMSAVALTADRDPEITLRVYGEAGTIELEFGYEGPKVGGIIRGVRDGEASFQTFSEPDALWGDSRADPIDLFYKEAMGPRAFIDAIIEDQPAVPSFYDGLKA